MDPKLKVKMIMTTNPIAKSTTPEQTAANGKISRGKYTLVDDVLVGDDDAGAAVNACAKYAQGTSAAK